MDEARTVLRRLRRIEALEREGAPARSLLAEVRALIEEAAAWVETDPGVSLHLAPSVIVDRNGRNLGLWRCPLPDESELPSSFVTERLLVQNFISAPAPVFRKDAWLACGGMDEALWYTGDWDIWLKLAANGPVRYHNTVTTAFRIHGGSQTVTASRDLIDFAVEQAAETRFRMEHFGATLTYLDRWKALRTARASLSARRAAIAALCGRMLTVPPARSPETTRCSCRR